MSLLIVEDLRVWFRLPMGRTRIHAVDGVSLTLEPGESVGLVGESGCGKTTLCGAVVGLLSPTAGRVLFDGRDVAERRGRDLAAYRRQVQMVFQDHAGALNPRLTVAGCLDEVLTVHGPPREGWRRGRAARRTHVSELLTKVGLDPAFGARFPHELSGGQRQRVGLARALAVRPQLIIADEPVSALDVSVQVQILNLMKDLRHELGLTLLLIAHDLGVVRYMCDRVLVMYLGRIVESGPVDVLYRTPAHPYTEALLSAVPDVERGLRARHGNGSRIVLNGDVPSPTGTIEGCPFHMRCHRARRECATNPPALVEVAPGHLSACRYAREMSA